MSNETPNSDPLEFMKGMWGNMGFSLPGMVTPTFDTDELEKRISDLKAVEGWLRMNLSMLQMTIQGLEMQHSTISAVKAMGQMSAEGQAAGAGDNSAASGAFAQAAMWPWSMMQQMQTHMQQQSAEPAAEPTGDTTAKPEAPAEPPPASPKRGKKQ